MCFNTYLPTCMSGTALIHFIIFCHSRYVPSSAKHRRRDLSSATIAAAVARTATTGAVDTEERLFTPSAPPVQRVSSSTGEGDDVMLEDAEPSGHTSTCADSATSTPVAPAMGCVANRSAASEEGSSRCLFKFSAPMSMGGGPGAREPWRYTPESATTGVCAVHMLCTVCGVYQNWTC